MSNETKDTNGNEAIAEERVLRDLKRRPRFRKNREIMLSSGERKKRTAIGWDKKEVKKEKI